jgi:hypothetical protein
MSSTSVTQHRWANSTKTTMVGTSREGSSSRLTILRLSRICSTSMTGPIPGADRLGRLVPNAGKRGVLMGHIRVVHRAAVEN